MDMRKTGTLLAAVVSGLCLAAALGCTSKTRYYVPEVRSFQPVQATVGSTVVISGGDFSDVWSVSFGGEPAQYYKVNGNNQIIATVPDNAVTGSIVVENPAGEGSSTFFGNPAFFVTPVITGIDPESGPVGTVVKVTGSGFVTASGVAIGTDETGSSSVTVNDPNNATVMVGDHATSGSVVLTVPGPDSGPMTATGPVFTVTGSPTS